MSLSPLAGKPAPKKLLPNIPRLVAEYYALHPDVDDPAQQVSFGTSGHRGSSLKKSFNEDHILAITQAIVEYRRAQADFPEETVNDRIHLGDDANRG